MKISRNRGAEYEREICAVISEAIGRGVTRNLGQARDGGDDITLDVDEIIRLTTRFRIECKRRRQLPIYAFMDQVARVAKKGEIPMVVARSDRRESLVILRLDDFLRLGVFG